MTFFSRTIKKIFLGISVAICASYNECIWGPGRVLKARIIRLGRMLDSDWVERFAFGKNYLIKYLKFTFYIQFFSHVARSRVMSGLMYKQLLLSQNKPL